MSNTHIKATRTIDTKGIATLSVTINGEEAWTTTGKRAAAAASIIVATDVVDADGNSPADLPSQDGSWRVHGTRSDARKAYAEAMRMTELNKWGRRYELAAAIDVVEAETEKPAKKAKPAKTAGGAIVVHQTKPAPTPAGPERAAIAVTMRKSGATLQAIADKLGYAIRQSARGAIQRGMAG
jgi:hypothetical protein